MCPFRLSHHQPRLPDQGPRSGACGYASCVFAGSENFDSNCSQSSARDPYPCSNTTEGGPLPPCTIAVQRRAEESQPQHGCPDEHEQDEGGVSNASQGRQPPSSRRSARDVQLVLPSGHHHRCDAIADEVGERSRFGHEAIDAENQASPATGIDGTTASVAASVMKPAPVTPEAPFEVSIATPRMVNCCRSVRSMLSACATNSEAIVK